MLINEKPVSNSDITVKTDKSNYAESEIIKITILNNSKADIFSHIGSLTPVSAIQCVEKKTCGKNWKKIFAECQYPNCISDVDAPQVIKPGESKTMEWNPLLFMEGTSESVQAKAGQYRLLVLYLDAERKNWKSEYTNYFTIK